MLANLRKNQQDKIHNSGYGFIVRGKELVCVPLYMAKYTVYDLPDHAYKAALKAYNEEIKGTLNSLDELGLDAVR